MNKWVVIPVLCTLISCGKPDPSYNPFDELFVVDVSSINEDKCDTVWGECGYINLTKDMGDHEVFYQVFIGEYHVYAKGMDIPLDTHPLKDSIKLSTEDSIWSAIISMPVDTERVDQILSDYGLSRNTDTHERSKFIWIYEDLDGNSYELILHQFSEPDLLHITRVLRYYKATPSQE